MYKYITLFIISLWLVGCSNDQVEKRKLEAPVSLYNSDNLAVLDEQILIVKEGVPEAWWKLFSSPVLDRLMAKALLNNNSLEAAKEALWQAEANLDSEIANIFVPKLGLGVNLARQNKTSLNPAGKNYGVSLSGSYNLNLFDLNLNSVDYYKAQRDYERFLLAETYLTLTSNLANIAISIAALQDKIECTEALIRLSEKQLALTKKQYKLGAASEANILAQAAQLKSLEASLPALRKQLAQSQHGLEAILGERIELKDLEELRLAKIALPKELPVIIPSELMRQRADIQAAEAMMIAADAQIGMATASLFPQLNITGSYANNTSKLKDIVSSAFNLWSLQAQIVQSLFQGGVLYNQRKAAIAGYNAAMAKYQQVVLNAFQNVADVLQAVKYDADAFVISAEAENLAKKSLKLVTKQVELGAVDYASLLQAEISYQQAAIAFITAKTARYSDSIALFQALGGGVENIYKISRREKCLKE